MVPGGASAANRSLVRHMPARVDRSWTAYFWLSRKARSVGPAWSSAATLSMRRSGAASLARAAPARLATSRAVSPFERVWNCGSVMPASRGAPAAASELGAAAEPEGLRSVADVLGEPGDRIDD